MKLQSVSLRNLLKLLPNDNDKAIPLSKRFNVQTRDVRYSFDEGEINVGHQEENTARNSGVKYSIKRTQKMTYEEQLKKGILKRRDSFYIGIPSETLQNTGFSKNPFAMNQGDLSKSMRVKGNNPHNSAHGISDIFINNLPNHLNEAVMFIDNGKKATIITSEEMKDRNGKDSLIVAGVWRDSTIDNDFVNIVKSIYPLDDIVLKIQNAVENGKLVVINKNKANDLLARVGIQTSERSRIISLAKEILSQPTEDVNKKSYSFADLVESKLNMKGKKANREYMRAVRKGDVRTQERLVYEAAELELEKLAEVVT